MAAFSFINGVYSVGVLNPNMRVFDIVMTTEYGTSYNAYLVKGEEKTALIETVHLDYFEDYWKNVCSIVDPASIDYLIMNHNEPDHSGGVKAVLEHCPNIQIICSQAGALYLKNIVNQELSPMIVKDGDSLPLGGKTLRFINAPFLHWPDSMFTWLPEDGVLFTCDFLGAHFCEPRMLDERLHPGDQAAYWSAMEQYFSAIFGPFKPYVKKGLDKLAGLEIRYAATSHGPILSSKGLLQKVMDYYAKQSTPSAPGKQLIPVFYCSAYHNTEQLAAEIAAGIREVLPEAESAVYDLTGCDMAQMAGLINRCDGCLIGSPTINRDAVPPVWTLLSHIDAVNFAKRPVGLFGSYGWSGEALPNLKSRLEGLKASLFEEPFRIVFVPTEEDLKNARDFGRQFAKAVDAKTHP